MIKTIISILTLISVNLNLCAQEIFSIRAGLQHFKLSTEIWNNDVFLDRNIIDIEGEIKIYNNFFSSVNIGYSQNTSLNSSSSIRVISIEPIRFYLIKKNNGIFVSPRITFLKFSENDLTDLTQNEDNLEAIGIVFGYNYNLKQTPLSIGLNLSPSKVSSWDGTYIGQAILNIGYNFNRKAKQTQDTLK